MMSAVVYLPDFLVLAKGASASLLGFLDEEGPGELPDRSMLSVRHQGRVAELILEEFLQCYTSRCRWTDLASAYVLHHLILSVLYFRVARG